MRCPCNTIGFHGQPFDGETGQSYFGARYYSPLTNRFMGVDPVGFDENNIHSFNRYAYGNNNPYKYIDPDGRESSLISDIWNYNPWLQPIRLAVESAENKQYGSAAVYAGMAVLPLAGKGGVSAAERGAAKGLLPDSALVCRGGACKAENFISGSGVTKAADGTLNGVSTQSRSGATLEELAKPFKNNQVGVTTAGDIRAAGGRVTADGHFGNPNHATVTGLSPNQLEKLFTPTVPNPVPVGQRGF